MSDNTTTTANTTTATADTKRETLPNLVRDVIFHYIKHYYEKWLADTGKSMMSDNDITVFVEKYYNEKQKDLRKYVRSTLKKNLGVKYNQLAVENILLEITQDPEFAKTRIRMEIEDYQLKKRC